MNDQLIMTSLEESVFFHTPEKLNDTFKQIKNDTYTTEEVLTALAGGIDKARRHFRAGMYSIPEFLLAIDAYRMGVRLMKANLREEKQKNGTNSKDPHIVIGVVEGDVHDMGKNIVSAVMEACGYNVLDMGNNVPNDMFLDALQSTNAGVLALSCMMSTPMDNMKALIGMVRKMFPKTAVIIGGAPFDADLARKIGADGYAESAIAIPDETRRLLPLSES
jgi:methanogenic corrinoid protein MtbC1